MEVHTDKQIRCLLLSGINLKEDPMTTLNQGRFFGNDQTSRPHMGRINQLKEDIDTMASTTVKALADAGASSAEMQAVERCTLELSAAIKKASAGVSARTPQSNGAHKNLTDC